MLPTYTLDKIKYATDGPTFEKAVGLYEGGKVTKFQETLDGFSAVVLGSRPYSVLVEARHFDRGSCECYVGQHDTVCKHMVTLAIRAVMGGRPLNDGDKRLAGQVTCSGQWGELNEEKLAATKKAIAAALSYIKPYRGPSRIWFGYQRSLSEGCNRLSALLGELPISEQTAALLVGLLLRLDRKLREGGVDDSDGTVGEFMEAVVAVLKEYARLEPACARTFHTLKNRETCFGWEASLLELIQ